MTWLSTAPWFVQSPWMLFALLSLIVPLAIHLFSKSKGKLIPFGNIKLIQLSKPVRMNEVRLVERLLLLCRLLVLFFSVLLLAQLYYDDRADNGSNREDNILVTQDWLNNANESELSKLAKQTKVDTVYLLSKLNKRLTSETILNWQSDKKQSFMMQGQQNTWLLVNNYAKTSPNNIKITVYSTNRLSQFIGDKVYLPENIAWQIKKLPVNNLTASMNALRSKDVSVLVFSDEDSNEDIAYLNAALSIVKETKLKNLTFTFQTNNSWRHDSSATDGNNQSQSTNLQHNQPQSNQIKETDHFDWIFYLSSSPVPASVLEEMKKGSKLIADAKHSEVKNLAHLVQWHEQMTQLQFPQMLMSLLLDESIKTYQMQQQLTNEQIESQLVNNIKVSSKPLLFSEQFKKTFIEKLLILLLVIFWSIERVLSEIKKVKQSTVLKDVVTNNSSDSSSSQKIKRN